MAGRELFAMDAVSTVWHAANTRLNCEETEWSRLGSNQRPSACEADALPLSHGTGWRAHLDGGDFADEETNTRRRLGRNALVAGRGLRDLCGFPPVHYCRASHRVTISPVARGCSAVGSASPCQGEGRGFESRHPLEGATGIRPNGGVAEW